MLKTILLFISLLIISPFAAAEDGNEIQVLNFVNSTWLGENRLKMTFDVKDHHKVYEDTIKLRSSYGHDIDFKNIKIDSILIFHDKFSNTERSGVKGTFHITADVYTKEDIKNDKYPLTLEYQACSDEYCLFPQDYNFTTSLFIKSSSMSLSRMMSEGLLLAMIFVFFAGFLTSFTPCIFPMIPLTLAVLIPRGQILSLRQKLIRSLSYVLGIAITYSVFGLIAASTGMMFGSFLGNKYVALTLGLFFVLFAISMLGFFEIKTPAFLNNSKLASGGNTFFFGLLAGVVAGPCVGPVLLSILTFISQSGDLKTGFALMISFAFGMGLIFIILGVAGDLMKVLPRSGAWLNQVKYVFAFIMFCLAIYYVRPVLSTSELYIFIFASLLLIATVHFRYYEKKFFAPLSQPQKNLWRLISVISLTGLILSVVFATQINSRHPDETYANGWVAFDEKTFDKILKNGKPTIVDFYADWCLSCKELKSITFSDNQVIEAGKEFNLLVVNATQSTPLVESLKKEHHVMGLPTLLFFDRKGQKIQELTLTGFESANDFLKRMKQTTTRN